MIRINLLPTKKARSASTGRGAVVLGVAIIAVELLGVGVLHANRSSHKEEVVRGNEEIRQRINRIKTEISDHDAIRAEIERIKARDEIITRLQAARTGPVLALMELSGILSPGQGPRVPREVLEQMRRDNPLTAPNERWDPRRLWLTQLEEENGEVEIHGQARGLDDVAEFFRRLRVSPYYDEVRMGPTRTIQDATRHLDLYDFEIHCTARYE